MQIKDVFDLLAQGELRDLALGGSHNGGVLSNNYDKVVPHLNMAIAEVYKRLYLLEKTVDVQCDPSILHYKMHTKYASTGGSIEPIKYILDTIDDPFLGDILKLEGIAMKVTNDLDDELSISVAMDTFTVPVATDELLEITYRAKPPSIDRTTIDINTTEVDVPYAYLGAILAFIGARVSLGKVTPEGTNLNMSYLSKFEMEIQKIFDLGLIASNNTTNIKAISNGWV